MKFFAILFAALIAITGTTANQAPGLDLTIESLLNEVSGVLDQVLDTGIAAEAQVTDGVNTGVNGLVDSVNDLVKNLKLEKPVAPLVKNLVNPLLETIVNRVNGLVEKVPGLLGITVADQSNNFITDLLARTRALLSATGDTGENLIECISDKLIPALQALLKKLVSDIKKLVKNLLANFKKNLDNLCATLLERSKRIEETLKNARLQDLGSVVSSLVDDVVHILIECPTIIPLVIKLIQDLINDINSGVQMILESNQVQLEQIFKELSTCLHTTILVD